VNTFALGNGFVLRKTFITFCAEAIQVFSFKMFREHFLESYLVLTNDPIDQVKVHFLKSVLASRPYIQQDVDLMIRFNNLLTQLRLSEIDSVAFAAERLDI